jgi:hypothetical protein
MYHVLEIGRTFEFSYPKNFNWHRSIDIVQILAQCHSVHCILVEFGHIMLLNDPTSGTVPSCKAHFWHCAITIFEPSAGQHDILQGSMFYLELLS